MLSISDNKSNLTNNLDAVLQVIQFIYDNIMYAELNTKSDYCQVCGYLSVIPLILPNLSLKHFANLYVVDSIGVP